MEQPYSRYSSYDPEEAEPGCEGSVLRNKLGVIDPELMQTIEEHALEKAYMQLWPARGPKASVTC